MVGGKWTTFRALGEHVSNLVLAELSKSRKVSTLGLQIGGGKNLPATDQEKEKWAAERASVLGLIRTRSLLTRYGTAAEKLIKYLEQNGDTELQSLEGYSEQEITYLAKEENAVRLDDFLLRRTTLAFSGLLNQERVSELAKVAAAALGWSQEQTQREMNRAWEILEFRHGVEKTQGRVAI